MYGARWYDPAVGRFTSVDPLAEDAPDWTPYRYGFNNPLIYTDPDGMFESRDAAEQYAKNENIKTGKFLGIFKRNNQIVENKDGSFSIDNKREHTSTQDFGKDAGGVQTVTVAAANDIMSVSNESTTYRDGRTVDLIRAEVIPIGGGQAINAGRMLVAGALAAGGTFILQSTYENVPQIKGKTKSSRTDANEQYEGIIGAKERAAKQKPSIKDSESEWEGSKTRPRQNRINSSKKSKQNMNNQNKNAGGGK